jgi:hypothetical protein
MFGEAPGRLRAGTAYASDLTFRADDALPDDLLPDAPFEGRNTRNAKPQELTCRS